MRSYADRTEQSLHPRMEVGSSTLRRWVSASILLHFAVVGALVYTRSPQIAPVEMPGERTGHLVSLTYSPGNSLPASTLQSRKRISNNAVRTRPVIAPTPAPAVAPASSAAVPPSAAATPGLDALGTGNSTLALVLEHPSPQPDLKRLPVGTRGDVIVDVVIDKTGRIAAFTVAKGLGHGVDETVLAAVKQWTFQPATRDGVPVDSEQELLFHYERG